VRRCSALASPVAWLLALVWLCLRAQLLRSDFHGGLQALVERSALGLRPGVRLTLQKVNRAVSVTLEAAISKRNSRTAALCCS
jgi:hypothetical protein